MMLMILNTTSAVINELTNAESNISILYEKIAQQYPQIREFFLVYSNENRKNKIIIQRAYYAKNKDDLDAESAFKKGLDTSKYSLKKTFPISSTLDDIFQIAVESEKTTIQLYSDTAKLSAGIMPYLHDILQTLIEKRGKRIIKIEKRRKKLTIQSNDN